jgi:hypothetical protein
VRSELNSISVNEGWTGQKNDANFLSLRATILGEGDMEYRARNRAWETAGENPSDEKRKRTRAQWRCLANGTATQ